jgi:hypothetical protein
MRRRPLFFCCFLRQREELGRQRHGRTALASRSSGRGSARGPRGLTNPIRPQWSAGTKNTINNTPPSSSTTQSRSPPNPDTTPAMPATHHQPTQVLDHPQSKLRAGGQAPIQPGPRSGGWPKTNAQAKTQARDRPRTVTGMTFYATRTRQACDTREPMFGSSSHGVTAQLPREEGLAEHHRMASWRHSRSKSRDQLGTNLAHSYPVPSGNGLVTGDWECAVRDSNPPRRIKSPELYPMS